MPTRRRPPGEPPRSRSEARERTNASVLARATLLRAVVSAPAEIAADLRSALQRAVTSQGGLAHFTSPAPQAITPMALNTLKTRAADVLAGGFGELDELRRLALAALRTQQAPARAPGRGTRAALQRRLAEQTTLVDRLYNEVALLSAKVEEYAALARAYAEQARDLPRFAERHLHLQRKYRHRWVPPRGPEPWSASSTP